MECHLKSLGLYYIMQILTTMGSDYWFFIQYARELAKLPRKCCMGSMFTHMISVWGLLIEHGYTDNVLLSAALIHDLFEDGTKVGFTDFERIKNIGEDGEAVYNLVKEVTIRYNSSGAREAKEEFLLRIMTSGSENAKRLKIADRISNLRDIAIPTITISFARRYLDETNKYIMPYSQSVDPTMDEELRNLVRLNSMIISNL
jgi:(p)ppGpp synthase/HD superfamily hydrolase